MIETTVETDIDRDAIDRAIAAMRPHANRLDEIARGGGIAAVAFECELTPKDEAGPAAISGQAIMPLSAKTAAALREIGDVAREWVDLSPDRFGRILLLVHRDDSYLLTYPLSCGVDEFSVVVTWVRRFARRAGAIDERDRGALRELGLDALIADRPPMDLDR